MAKAGMRRPDVKEPHGTESNKKMADKKNPVKPVAETKGKSKASTKAKTDNTVSKKSKTTKK